MFCLIECKYGAGLKHISSREFLSDFRSMLMQITILNAVPGAFIEIRCSERNERIYNHRLAPALRLEIILFAGA
jgi:hypothetical protein